jgi:chemotaxis protein methyltransferase CheR
MIREEEAQLLVQDVLELYGYDFTEYAHASLRRRINRLFVLDRFPSFAEFRYRIRQDEAYLRRFVEEITVNVTEMFRDPAFFQTLQREVLPTLATYPLIRIWHAGCATGEEVYSLAILLEEAGLLHKALQYATDLNPSVLDQARAGIFPLSHMRQYSENYIQSGGTNEFSSYYTANYDRAILNGSLRRNMIFSTHNLVSDGSFNEFQLILCRNVLIYFDKELQDRALQLFDASLEQMGFLALGSKETLRFSNIHNHYRQLGSDKIWRKQSCR